MITLDLLNELYGHMEWADQMVWDTVEAMAVDDDERLAYLLYHTHATQQAFLGVWTEREVDAYDPGRFTRVSPIRQWAAPYYAELGTFVAGLDAGHLNATVAVPWSKWFSGDGGAGPTTLGETMLQVAMHSTYHRAQVNTRIRELGGEPPTVDYIVWLWRQRPTARR